MTIHIFSGPTIGSAKVKAMLPMASVHGPIRHGDLFRLDLTNGDTVLIIDGLWHQTAPIRHKEILDALARGVTVVGAASTGALRAVELRPYGMVGVGRIFHAYAAGQILADDEVAVVQDSETGAALSDALVTMRFALADAAAQAVLSETERDLLFSLARQLPYPTRSWTRLHRCAVEEGMSDAWRRFTQWRPLDSHNAKLADAQLAINLLVAGAIAAPAVGEWSRGVWRTSFLRHWQAKFTPVAVPQTTLAAMLRHQMIYDPGFPARWRRLVLAWIAGADVDDPAPLAVAAAARRGLTYTALRPTQKSHWLTQHEMATLEQAEAMTRILVRSARLDTAAERIWPANLHEASALLNPAMNSAAAADRARQVNEEIAATGRHREPRHLRADVVRRHLAAIWGVPDDTAVLDAAARDRAFHDHQVAVNAARLFYLAAKGGHPAAAPEETAP